MHISYSIYFFFSKNRSFYEIKRKTLVEPDRPQMTIQRMRIARWITKATDPHSAYVKLIAFLLQQRLHKMASRLRYTYLHCQHFLTLRQMIIITTTALFKGQGQSQLLPSSTSTIHRSNSWQPGNPRGYTTVWRPDGSWVRLQTEAAGFRQLNRPPPTLWSSRFP